MFNFIVQQYDLYNNIDLHLENRQTEAKLYSDVWRLFRASDVTDRLKIPILQQNKELERYITRRNIKVIPIREHSQFMSAIYSVDEVFSRSSEILDELSSSNDSVVSDQGALPNGSQETVLKDQIKIEIRKAAAVMIRVKIAMLLITCLQLDQEVDPVLFTNEALETAKNFIPNNIPFI